MFHILLETAQLFSIVEFVLVVVYPVCVGKVHKEMFGFKPYAARYGVSAAVYIYFLCIGVGHVGIAQTEG